MEEDDFVPDSADGRPETAYVRVERVQKDDGRLLLLFSWDDPGQNE